MSLFMKHLHFSMAVAVAGMALGMFISGCSITTQDWMSTSQVKANLEASENSTSQMQTLKGSGIGKQLTEAFELYVRLQTQRDKNPELQAAMEEARQAFFDSWKEKTDSIAESVDYEKFMKSEIRYVIEAVWTEAFSKNAKVDSRYIVYPKDLIFVELYAANFDELDEKANEVTHDMKRKAEEFYADARVVNHESLAMTEEMNAIFNTFMGVDESSYFNRADEEMRINFLKPGVQVSFRKEGTGFYYETFPSVEFIYLNMEHTFAKAFVRESVDGGSYYYIKENSGEWVVEKIVKAKKG